VTNLEPVLNSGLPVVNGFVFVRDKYVTFSGLPFESTHPEQVAVVVPTKLIVSSLEFASPNCPSGWFNQFVAEARIWI
jgi:hypothetical protein